MTTATLIALVIAQAANVVATYLIYRRTRDPIEDAR